MFDNLSQRRRLRAASLCRQVLLTALNAGPAHTVCVCVCVWLATAPYVWDELHECGTKTHQTASAPVVPGADPGYNAQAALHRPCECCQVALPGCAVPMSMASSVCSTHCMHVVAATFPYTICCALGLHCLDGLHCSTRAGPSRPGRRYTAACSVRDMVQGCAVCPGCCYLLPIYLFTKVGPLAHPLGAKQGSWGPKQPERNTNQSETSTNSESSSSSAPESTPCRSSGS
jgi:hypothetical protein